MAIAPASLAFDETRKRNAERTPVSGSSNGGLTASGWERWGYPAAPREFSPRTGWQPNAGLDSECDVAPASACEPAVAGGDYPSGAPTRIGTGSRMRIWRDPENNDVARGLGEAAITGSAVAMLIAAAGFVMVRLARVLRSRRSNADT